MLISPKKKQNKQKINENGNQSKVILSLNKLCTNLRQRRQEKYFINCDYSNQ